MQIRALYILSDDLEATKKFYHHSLGLKIIFESVLCHIYELKTSLLIFYSSEKKNPVYHIAFNIPSNQVREALIWMQQRAEMIPVTKNTFIADFSNWNAEAFYFFDNNRNIIEFIARRDLHNASASAFNSDAILSISEIGLVSENVKNTCEDLMQEYGLQYFLRQPPLEQFAAIGDDHGLFIVVQQNRNWYPTNIPSSLHWLKIEFEHEGGRKIFGISFSLIYQTGLLFYGSEN